MNAFINNFLIKIGLRGADSPENESSPGTTTRSSRTCSNRSGILDFDEHNGRKTGSQPEFKFAKGNGFEGHETIRAVSTKPRADRKFEFAKGNGFEGHETIRAVSTKPRADRKFEFAKGNGFEGDETIRAVSTRSSAFGSHETIMNFKK